MQHTPEGQNTLKRRAALWGMGAALAVLCAVAVTYYWRVFYEYAAVPARSVVLWAGAVARCGTLAGWVCV